MNVQIISITNLKFWGHKHIFIIEELAERYRCLRLTYWLEKQEILQVAIEVRGKTLLRYTYWTFRYWWIVLAKEMGSPLLPWTHFQINRCSMHTPHLHEEINPAFPVEPTTTFPDRDVKHGNSDVLLDSLSIPSCPQSRHESKSLEK